MSYLHNLFFQFGFPYQVNHVLVVYNIIYHPILVILYLAIQYFTSEPVLQIVHQKVGFPVD